MAYDRSPIPVFFILLKVFLADLFSDGPAGVFVNFSERFAGSGSVNKQRTVRALGPFDYLTVYWECLAEQDQARLRPQVV